jgi:hypothetical protein
MLDKRTQKFLSVVAGICADGSYKIIEKVELAKIVSDAAVLGQIVRYLQDNEMVDVKYVDETVYCLTVLPKGRVAVERTAGEQEKFGPKIIALIIGGCFLAAFLGGLIGAVVGNLC